MNTPTPAAPGAPLSDLEARRTARHLALPGFGPVQQKALHDAHVFVVGAGGLGCPAMQSLAAAGVGHLTIIDDDLIDLSNIHRQILFGAQDVGRPKVEVAAERLRELQPGITINQLQQRLTSENALSLLSATGSVPPVDLILDGSDSFATKYLLADAAEITGIALAWGTVLRFSGQLALFHSGPTTPRGVGLRDLFPTQPRGDAIPDCATAGVLGATTAVIGALLATEAIKYLTALDSVPGRLLSYDALAMSTRTVHVNADPARPLVTELGDYCPTTCTYSPPGEGAMELLAQVEAGEAFLLDIREPHEYLLADSLRHLFPLRLPLSEISSPARVEELLAELPSALPLDTARSSSPRSIVVHCASGVRSAKFCEDYASQASSLGFDLRSLPGGINGITPPERRQNAT